MTFGENSQLESIGNYAFGGCTNLENIIIPDSVTSIGIQAFQGCSSLTSINIPEGVTSIGTWAFKNCGGLESITISDSVTSIGENAFSNTGYSKNDGNWTKNLLYIGNHLIEAKNTITGCTIKDTTKTIADSAFKNCSELSSIIVEQGNTKYDSRNNCNAIIETATNKLIVGCQKTVIPIP